MQSVQQLKSSVETDISDNENVTSVTIKINGTGNVQKATVTINVSEGATAVTASTPNASLKSSGWPEVTYTLDPGTGEWKSSLTTGTKAENTKEPKKNMNEVFSIN